MLSTYRLAKYLSLTQQTTSSCILLNQNKVYCQVGFHLKGICLGVPIKIKCIQIKYKTGKYCLIKNINIDYDSKKKMKNIL